MVFSKSSWWISTSIPWYVMIEFESILREVKKLMYISHVELVNFRGIEHLELQLDQKSTVFFGINGVGKSSVLHAIDLLYANIIRGLTKSKKELAKLDEDDIMSGKSRAMIKAGFMFDGEEEITYHRNIDKIDRRKHSKKNLADLISYFEEKYITVSGEDEDGNLIRVHDDVNMPVFVNYGVNRLVVDTPVEITKKNFSKLDAFDKAIESKIDFRSLFEWFRYREDIENQEKVRNDLDYEDRDLKAVKMAMSTMLDGFDNIHIEREPLALMIEKDGKTLKLNQLSDGEKCTLALFGDLARRMSLANPGLADPLCGEGVVLIDELELHMHTTWQRKILPALTSTFPKIQFIITTHSPQVLGEIGEDFNIVLMTKEDGEIFVEPVKSLYGWDSNVILEEKMETSSVNEQVKKLENLMYRALQEKAYNFAEELADELDEITLGRNEHVAKVRVLISRGRKNAKNR